MSLGGRVRPKPRHECVGTAQVAALQAEVAELTAFKAEVVELYTMRFRGEVSPPDPGTLVPRIRTDRMVAQTARTAMARDGEAPAAGTPLNLRGHLTVEWLKKLNPRLQFRGATERTRADRIRDLEWELASMRGKCCHAHQCQPSPRQIGIKRFKTGTAHPPTTPQTAPDVQLDRIESLVKQAASTSEAGPISYGFLIGAVLVGLTHLIW